jgi:DNA gyrase subunit A
MADGQDDGSDDGSLGSQSSYDLDAESRGTLWFGQSKSQTNVAPMAAPPVGADAREQSTDDPMSTPAEGHGSVADIPLHDETQRRYLNYALSVITSRALPDVRDGLKPVQRRILYAMHHNLHLSPDAKHRKSAAIVGAVLAQYHPHGDVAVYDAMVRMAQDFSLRYPLVDGYGNFGSLDGDAAAAYRYTEARLRPVAAELLEELPKRTIDYRPNFDGTTFEPITLPARYPQLLVNGSTGIAVGMATNIPPHHLGEIVAACVALIDDPSLTVGDLLRHIKGPDFPTGGTMLNTKAELRAVYEAGQGTIKLRADYKIEELGKGQQQLVITSIPYGLSTNAVVEKIAQVIIAKGALPQLLDVRNESTRDVRLALELKKGADPQLVMAYLYKHTPLQTNFNVNLTCLVPTDNVEVAAPRRLDLRAMLGHFLDYRFLVVTRRFRYELEELLKRIHLLEGFEKIYDALDEALRIIRTSDGKRDAAAKLMRRFDLDEEQADAVLEMKLYKLARLEIEAIREELADKRKEAKRIEKILASDARRWGVIRGELAALGAAYDDKRRTKLGGKVAEVHEFDEQAFIVDEDAHVIVTRDGWLKRVRELKDPRSTRLREGDELLAVVAGSTKSTVAFFTNLGTAYSLRMNDVPPSTGYGDPIQKLFKLKDGERVVAALSLDERATPAGATAIVATRQGFGARFALAAHLEPSTRAGRRFVKLAADGGDSTKGDDAASPLLAASAVALGAGTKAHKLVKAGDLSEGRYVFDEVIGVELVDEKDNVLVAATSGKALLCRISEVAVLANPGRGVRLIKLEVPTEQLVGMTVHAPLVLETAKGKIVTLDPKRMSRSARGSAGDPAAGRDRFVAAVAEPRLQLIAG